MHTLLPSFYRCKQTISLSLHLVKTCKEPYEVHLAMDVPHVYISTKTKEGIETLTSELLPRIVIKNPRPHGTGFYVDFKR
ncbi:MAG: hypothetical protein AAB492_02030, partial [Patescibacteria group bacterium]